MQHILLNNEIMKKKDDFFQLEKDQEAVVAFQEHLKGNMMEFASLKEKIKWMIDNQYYEDFSKKYTMRDVVKLFSMIYDHQFKFQSYMAISKFYNTYAVKTNDKSKYLENYEDRIVANALHLAGGDFNKAKEFAECLIEQRFQPATPTFLNAGRARRGELVSCFLLSVDDDKHSISYVERACLYLSSIGGGIAVNLSRLRARTESIKGIKGVAKGVVAVAKIYESVINYADQQGQRDGSAAMYLNVFHADLEEFLGSKKINADESSRLQTLSLGLIIPNKFFEIAEKNENMFVFGPHSVFTEYGVHLDDMNMEEWYEKLATNERIFKKEVNPRDILTKIAEMQKESGYPYLMFKDNANKVHALKDIGEIKMSNLCTEIFQIQETSTIMEYHIEDIVKRDISCNLGSLNIDNVMSTRKFRETVHTAMDMLTLVSDMTHLENVPSVAKANKELHSVGLGAMNLHGFLAKNHIMYESFEARDFARTFFMMMNYYSLERSMLIAKERKVTFEGFEQSEYAKGTYFNKYEERDYSPKSEKAKALFEGMHIPTIEDWRRLKADVQEYGVYHAYRQAIAPNGSISYVQNSTAGVMPIMDMVEERKDSKAKTFFPMPFLNQKNMWFYKSAYNMDPFKMIDMIAVIQEHVDQGISTTLFVSSDCSTRDLVRLYIYANKKGLKSLYYTRQKTNRKVDQQECVNCAV